MSVNPQTPLSEPARNALQWAWALARFRAEQENQHPDSAVIDPYDLFIAIILEQPEDSEAKALLDYFHLSPGQILPPGYRIPTQQDLQRHLNQLSPEQEPPLSGEAESVVYMGTDLAMRDTRNMEVELSALYAGFFIEPNPLTQSIEKALGTSLSPLVSINEEYMANAEKGPDYGELLKQRFNYNLSPVAIPNYKSDHGQQAGLAQDLVDIKVEVDAFAYLLASRGLNPPLAVGLFGDWGSGKSFFMESVRERIEQLTQDPDIREKRQNEVPFWKRVVQIQFNAWHYVEGDLWASLVDHIFNQLRLGEENESQVERRRKFWQQQLVSTKEKLEKLEAEKIRKSVELSSTKEQAVSLKNQLDQELDELKKLRSKKVNEILLHSSIDQFKQSITQVLSAGEDEVAVTPDKVRKQLSEARSELQRGAVLWRALWCDRKQAFITIGLLLLTPIVVSLVEMLPEVSGSTPVFAGISTAMATVMGLLSKATLWVRQKLDEVSKAEIKIDEEINDTVNSWQQAIRICENTIRVHEQKLTELNQSGQRIENEIESITEQLESVTPVKVLNEFVAERVGSSDYRKWLGLPALIQRDFRQLSSLVREHNEEYLRNDLGGSTNENYFNRIILYIDDLDRCPDDRVVEVLQAVHLLLAFDLFVVVVAVDARWLNHALIKHFPALVKNKKAGSQGDTGQATADDYLEKIFQIPFWVQALGDGAKKNMVSGLLRGHILHEEADRSSAANGQGPSIGESQLKVLASLNPAAALPVLQTENFSLSRNEFDFIQELSPILGETPRAVKRFVNLYQLVRIIHRSRAESETQSPPGEQLVAFLLALGDGLPVIGEQLMKAIKRAETVSPEVEFKSLVADLSSVVYSDERRRLDAWLQQHKQWEVVKVSRIAVLLPLVERFLFRVGEQLLSSPDSSAALPAIPALSPPDTTIRA